MDRKMVATVCVILCLVGILYYAYQMIGDIRAWHDYLYMLCLFGTIAVSAYPIACYGSTSEIHSRYLLDRTWREQFVGYSVIAVVVVVSLLINLSEPLSYLKYELGSLALLILLAGGTYLSYRKQRRSL